MFSGSLTEEMINLFLRAGSSLTIESVPKMPKSVDWLQTSGPEAWLNIMKLSTDLEFFANPKLNLSIERDVSYSVILLKCVHVYATS